MRNDLAKAGVADTSLVVSAFIRAQGSASKALPRMRSGMSLLASEDTLRELLLTLTRPKFDRWLSHELRMKLFAHYCDSVTMMLVTEEVRVCRDQRDNMFLELALSGRADVIVTGDDDLLCRHPWRGIAILSPADYLALAG